MPTIFTKIINGEIPSHKIAENEEFLAFLDIRPLKRGHTLVIPKQEIDYIFDIENDLLGRMMVFAKGIAKAVRATVPCKRIGVAVVGLEVPHAHIHLVPIESVSDLSFEHGFLSTNQEELTALAAAIRNNYQPE